MTNTCTCKAEHWQPHADSCPLAKQSKNAAVRNESHTDLYPALQTAIAKIEDQKREIERLGQSLEPNITVSKARDAEIQRLQVDLSWHTNYHRESEKSHQRKDDELTQLRGNLSLAEDGLAAATQEIQRHQQLRMEGSAYIAGLQQEIAQLKGEAFVLKTANARLRAQLADCELSLRVWDGGTTSEYWLRHRTAEPFTHPFGGHPHQVCACGAKVPTDTYVLHTCGDRLTPTSTAPEPFEQLPCTCMPVETNLPHLRGMIMTNANCPRHAAKSPAEPNSSHAIDVELCPSCAATLAVAQAKARELALKSEGGQ